MITRELDLASTTFCDATILIYEIEAPLDGKKIDFDSLDGEDCKISCIIGTITNSPTGNQLPTQAKKNVWIIAINGEYPITDKGVLDDIQLYQTLRGKSKVNISLPRRKIYQQKDIGDIWSKFYHIRPVLSHLEVSLPEKTLKPNKIGEYFKGYHRKFRK